MKIKVFFLLWTVICFSSLVFGQTENNKLNQWLGEYQFDTLKFLPTSKKNETVPSSNYTLKIAKNKNGNDFNCNFMASGVQLYDEFTCSVKNAGNKLQVYFVKDITGKDEEFIDYKRGQFLFSLQPSAESSDKYLFESVSYKILIPGTNNKSILFTKSDSESLDSANEVDLKIKGIGLGSSYAEMEKQFGKPLKVRKTREIGCDGDDLETEVTAIYSGVIIKFLNGDNKKLFVYSIEVTSPDLLIIQEIKMGISPKTMERKLGKSKPLGKEEEYELFTYVNKDNNGSAIFYFKAGKLIKVAWVSETC